MGFYWIDEKYLLQLSGSLKLFKRKGGNLFNHRCPFCGDSSNNETKCRGFHYELNGTMIYKCHNCGKSCTTANFIKELDPDLYKEYRMEVYKESGGRKVTRPKRKQHPTPAPQNPTQECLLDSLMNNANTLKSNHKAVKFLLGRMIPKELWGELYYIDDMRKIGQLKEKYKGKLKKAEDRLVIPYRDRTGAVIGITCRSFEPNPYLRYITIPIKENIPQVYGMDKLNINETIYVTEGAFDSMFVDNCIAVSGSNLKMVDQILPKNKAVLIFDCQPRNKQLVKLISQAIKLKYSIALMPETGYKDVNAMIQGGIKKEKIMKIIKENTVCGLGAELKFNKWKKVL